MRALLTKRVVIRRIILSELEVSDVINPFLT
jgi:hypothetical protein